MQKEQLIFLASGHTMNKTAYDQRATHFGSLLEQFGAVVEKREQPDDERHDYQFTVLNMEVIPRDLHTKFSKAGMAANIVRADHNQFVVKLRSIHSGA